MAKVEAGSGKSLREALGEALNGPVADLAQPSVGTRLLKALTTALSFKASYDSAGRWSFGVDLAGASGGGADTGVLETDVVKLIKDVADAAADRQVGLAVLIDEAQDLEKNELAVVSAAAHQASQETWPAVFALAGLPSLPRLLAEATTYTERLFPFEPIEHLHGDIARAALIDPAVAEGVAWSTEP